MALAQHQSEWADGPPLESSAFNRTTARRTASGKPSSGETAERDQPRNARS